MATAGDERPRDVRVPFDRLAGWLTRYDDAHPGTVWTATAESVAGESPDGTRVRIDVPFPPLSEPSAAGLVEHVARPWRAGLVLVRKGGFAVARLDGSALVDSKLGRRHVQGKTKAGGWSQQRFARRRDNQARAAYDAAAGHVHQILGPAAARLDLLGVGGDRTAVAAVLAHPELATLAALPRRWLGALPDPTRAVVDSAVGLLRSVEMTITDPPPA